jgi:hypothetical protein
MTDVNFAPEQGNESPAFDTWQGMIWQAWGDAGHAARDCIGWTYDSRDGRVACTTCLRPVPLPGIGAAA